MAIYRLSNGTVMKATRGRVRTPKVRQSDGLVPWRAGAKQNMPVRWISHEVLWSAMRPRIAFGRRNAVECAVPSADRPGNGNNESRTTHLYPSPQSTPLGRERQMIKRRVFMFLHGAIWVASPRRKRRGGR